LARELDDVEGKPFVIRKRTADRPQECRRGASAADINNASGPRSGRQGQTSGSASWISEDALDGVRKVAPEWDRQWLLSRYQEWTKGKPTPANIDAAFLGWAKKFTKGKGPR
jgi:hypothetical protein